MADSEPVIIPHKDINRLFTNICPPRFREEYEQVGASLDLTLVTVKGEINEEAKYHVIIKIGFKIKLQDY